MIIIIGGAAFHGILIKALTLLSEENLEVFV